MGEITNMKMKCAFSFISMAYCTQKRMIFIMYSRVYGLL